MIGALSIAAGFASLVWMFGAAGAAAGAVLVLVLVVATARRH